MAGQPLSLWLGFLAVVAVLLALDLGLLNRKDHVIRARESLLLSAGYIAMALAFGGWVWWKLGEEAGLQYLTGFVIEKSLAMDNIFVIAMIFGFFAVPAKYQHRVLFWGIIGALVMRGVMIGLGAALIERFDWILYVFGAFLLFTGVKMLRSLGEQYDVAHNPLLGFLRRHLRVTPQPHEGKFFVRLPESDAPGARKVLWATPLFLALLMVEAVDLVFAVDSVPAIFAVSRDPFIVYSSNIFAILGLRALYFALAALIERFRYLKVALAAILVFVGAKILAVDLVGHIPPVISLGITTGLLAAGIGFSLWRTRSEPQPSLPATSRSHES